MAAKNRILVRSLAVAISCVLVAFSFVRAETAQLALNENPFGPSPLVETALRENSTALYRYVGEEARALTVQIAVKEGVDPEQIILGDVLEELGRILALSGGSGGEFVYSVPGYPALVDAASALGGVPVAVPLNAALENDLPALAAKLGERTRAVFLVNPHNPSGTLNSAEAFSAFIASVSRRAVVVVDEAYLEYSEDYAARTAVTFIRSGANVVVFRTFSKIYGLAALPLGYAVAPKSLAAELRRRGLGDPHALNKLALVAAAASLRDSTYVDGIREAVANERARWNQVLDGLHLKHSAARASFVYFDAGRPQSEVAAALKADGILVGRVFPPLENWVRITIGQPEENRRAQEALKKFYAGCRN